MRVLRALEWTLGATAVGFLWGGAPGAVAGSLAGTAARVVKHVRRGRRREERIDEALIDFVASIGAAVRAGCSIPRALTEAHAPPPLDDAVWACLSRLRVGASLDDGLQAFAVAAGTEQARIVATAIAIGHRSGGELPSVLDVLAQISRERMRVAREVRAATAQARMSSWIVALLPVVFLFMTGAASREQTRLLLGTPAGWVLLSAGALLEGAGVLWMRRIGAEP